MLFFHTQNKLSDIRKDLILPEIGDLSNFGQQNYLEIADQSYDIGTEDFSISTWVKTNSSSTQMLIQKGGLNGASDPQYWLRLNDQNGELIFLTGDGTLSSSFVSSQTPLDDNLWHHIVAKRIGNEISIYIDGEEDVTSQNPLQNCSNAQSVKIGVQIYNGNNNFLNGQISGMRVYKSGLSAVQIKQLMAFTNPI